MAGEVALEDPGRVACAFAFADAAGDVEACCWVVLAAVEHDRVQCSVELAVSAAAESVTRGQAAGGREGCDAGEPGEGGFGGDAVLV